MLNSIIQIIKDFFESPSFGYNLFAIIIAVGGLLYSIIRDYIQNKKKQPSYWIRTNHLVRKATKNMEGIRIMYNEEEVPNLSSTEFIFWNRGKDAIRSTDVASKNPIKITISDEYRILDAFIEKFTNEDNNFTIVKKDEDHSVLINFEFMEHNDGVTLRLTHTAPDNSHFKVTGKVISGTKIELDRSVRASATLSLLFGNKHQRRDFNFYKWIMFFSGVIMMFLPSLFLKDESGIVKYLIYAFFIVVGLFYIYHSLFVLKNRIPSKLDAE